VFVSVCVCVCVCVCVRARASGYHAVELVAIGDRLCDTWEKLSCWVPLPPTQTQTLNRTRARACAHARTRTERVREIEIARESMCIQVFVASHPLHSLSPPLCHRWMLEIYAYAEPAATHTNQRICFWGHFLGHTGKLLNRLLEAKP